MTTRRRANIAMAVWALLFVISILTTDVPYISPLSFIVVVFVAWDYGLRPALAWVGVVHILIPAVLVLLGTGPFFVFVEARGLVAIIMLGSLVAVTALAYLTHRVRLLAMELHNSKLAISSANEKLQAALDEVKELRGLVPICAWCKDIRDDSGNWEELTTYITRHSHATFSHGLCPKCLHEQLGALKHEHA